ncbi:MAG: tRNA (adenosine(37)-N6)-threonylcarbamoyltransferase complex dimerization subunit type 1 TsaB [Clostridia bacterium]|nr:tRNA (adenosine(37)-N6)-threonylcarbamoyltransferase complex dimerization subunit type 1 TsaB [Clostridia bacterium]
MKILAIDSSAISAGCAIVEDGGVMAESFVRVGLTHSETLLPMVSNTLANAKLTAEDIDCFAVSSGPGSFTGIRIGVAAVKGMAFTRDTPCVGVSTLEAIAWNCAGLDGMICAVMDARRQQVYNALFTFDGQNMVRLCEDRAISIEALTEEIRSESRCIRLVGDGALLCYEAMREKLPNVRLVPEHLRYARGSGVAKAAQRILSEEGAVTPDRLVPTYLRPSQAEREKMELKKKKLKEYERK